MQAEMVTDDSNGILLLLEQKSYGPPKRVEKPLPFEHLNAGITSKSQAWLFQLPFDILDEIFNYIPLRSLSSFALASRDCCRLARGRQFTNVTLDYSPNSWALSHRLLSEADLGRGGVTQRARLPSIGPAVRQVSICTAKEYIQQYHSIYSIWEPRRISGQKVEEAWQRYTRYIRTVQLVLASSLPNIETVIWADRVPLDEDTYLALRRSTFRGLILNEVAVDRRFHLGNCADDWPLRTLHLGMADVPSRQLSSQTSKMCNALLRMCAPHLESLTWVERPSLIEIAHSFSGDAVQLSKFSALRQLQISGLKFADHSVLESLISPNEHLRRLDIQFSYVGRYLSKCGSIHSLDILTWLPQPDEPDDQLISFLQDNSHIKKLYLRKAYTSSFLDSDLLPLLGSSFKCLTSLSLIQRGMVLEESSLELISKIHTLELLHLSVGDQRLFFEWVVDHERIRRNLSELAYLKTLLLSRDVRTIQSGPSSQHSDSSSTDSDDDTSSMTFADNPNTDLAAIIAAVSHGAIGNTGNVGGEGEVGGVGGGEEEEEEEEEEGEQGEEASQESEYQDDLDDGDNESDSDDDSFDLNAASHRVLSLLGSPSYNHGSLSRIFQHMRDEKVEQEAQKYFATLKKLEMLYIGRQIFDRGCDEQASLPWRTKRWAHSEDFLPSMLGRMSIGSEYGLEG
jgi:hypothetical protein